MKNLAVATSFNSGSRLEDSAISYRPTPSSEPPKFRKALTFGEKKHKTELMMALTQNKTTRCARGLEKSFRSQDLFGQHVHFTYKGKSTYKTNIGALVSIFVKAILAIFIVYEFYVIFSRKHPAVSIKRIIDEEVSKISSLNPRDRGFDIAIAVLQKQNSSSKADSGWTIQSEANWVPIQLDQSYGKISARLVRTTTDYQTPLKKTEYQHLITTICDDTNFRDVTASVKEHMIVGQNAQCIGQQNQIQLEIKEANYTNVEAFVSLSLEQCRNGTNQPICKSQGQIDSYFKNLRAEVYQTQFTISNQFLFIGQIMNVGYRVYINTNFNFKDFSHNPIQYYLEKPIVFNIYDQHEQEANIYIMEAKTELIDNFFAYWQKLSTYFFQVSDIQMHFAPFDQTLGVLASVKIKLDNQHIIYGRVADTIFSGLESIGGFYESLIHIGMILVIFFQKRLFTRSFLRQLYQVDAETIPHTVKIPSNRHMISKIEKDEPINESYLKLILNFLLLRTRLQYGYSEIVHYLLKCRCLGMKRAKASDYDKRHLLFQRGKQKLDRELDVVNLLKATRQLKLMSQFILTKEQRTLELQNVQNQKSHQLFDC